MKKIPPSRRIAWAEPTRACSPHGPGPRNPWLLPLPPLHPFGSFGSPCHCCQSPTSEEFPAEKWRVKLLFFTHLRWTWFSTRGYHIRSSTVNQNWSSTALRKAQDWQVKLLLDADADETGETTYSWPDYIILSDFIQSSSGQQKTGVGMAWNASTSPA